MIQSMTAYASRNGELGDRRWRWELKGVNGRGLDIRLRLPDGLPGFEPTVRTALKTALSRGTVTLGLRITRIEGGGGARLDPHALDAALDAFAAVADRAAEKGVDLRAPTAGDLLAQRGVVGGDVDDDANPAELIAALTVDLGPLLSDFTTMRGQEGAALQKMIAGQLDRISQLVDQAAKLAEARKPEVRRALREAFERVLAEVTEADEARLAQELAVLAVKQDVTEEIDRLRAHVGAAWQHLEAEGPVGRTLDFLAQEFMREANTLCSKSQNTDLTAVGLELKTVIDQMREQIQNVE